MRENINYQIISDVGVHRLKQKFSTNSDIKTSETDRLFLWIMKLFLNKIDDNTSKPERYLKLEFSIKDKNGESICIQCNNTQECFWSDKELYFEEFIQIIKDVVSIFNSFPQYRAVYRESEDFYKTKIIVILGI